MKADVQIFKAIAGGLLLVTSMWTIGACQSTPAEPNAVRPSCVHLALEKVTVIRTGTAGVAASLQKILDSDSPEVDYENEYKTKIEQQFSNPSERTDQLYLLLLTLECLAKDPSTNERAYDVLELIVNKYKGTMGPGQTFTSAQWAEFNNQTYSADLIRLLKLRGWTDPRGQSPGVRVVAP